MSGNVILDVAIGLAFIYLILSLMCSAIQEFLASLFAMRANNLETGIRNMLNDPNDVSIADEFFVHPLITRLAKQGKKPSYIPSRMFALALLDSVKSSTDKAKATTPADKPAAAQTVSPNTVGSPMAMASKIVAELPPDSQLRAALSTLIADAQGDVDKIRSNIETWFDDNMDRVSGWYKRKAKLMMLGIAFLLAAGMNVDSIYVTQSLWKDPSLRESLVVQAQAVNKTATPPPGFGKLDQQLSALLPIGWHCEPKDKAVAEMVHNFGATTLPGWLITAICVSLGAPFWFDALEKLLNIRAAGNKPNKSGAGK